MCASCRRWRGKDGARLSSWRRIFGRDGSVLTERQPELRADRLGGPSSHLQMPGKELKNVDRDPPEHVTPGSARAAFEMHFNSVGELFNVHRKTLSAFARK